MSVILTNPTFFFRQKASEPDVLVVRTVKGNLELRRYAAGGTHMSLPPHCGGRRETDRRLPELLHRGEHRLAEFHTHPSIPTHDIAPPSAADLYQLMLACAKHEHNLAYVVSAEGLYVCEMQPRACKRVMQDLRTFLHRNRYTEDEIASAVNGCEQPRGDVLDRHASAVPALHGLLRFPVHLYQTLTQDTSSDTRRTRIRTFQRGIRNRLGISIQFLPHSSAVA